MTKGIPSTPIITETEEEVHNIFETFAERMLREDDLNEIRKLPIDEYYYEHVNNLIAWCGFEILIFKNINVNK
jgi:hypothetical protein